MRIENHQRTDGAERGADPETAVDDEVRHAAPPRWHEFLNGRIYGCIFAADTCPGRAAKEGKRPRIP